MVVVRVEQDLQGKLGVVEACKLLRLAVKVDWHALAQVLNSDRPQLYPFPIAYIAAPFCCADCTNGIALVVNGVSPQL